MVSKNWSNKRKQKFDAGKYDEAVDKIGSFLSKLKSKGERTLDEKYIPLIQDLEDKKDQLKKSISDYNKEDGRIKEEQSDSLVNELDKLMKDAEKVGWGYGEREEIVWQVFSSAVRQSLI